MLRATFVILTLGALPRGCACADAGELLPATTVTQSATSTSTPTAPPPPRAAAPTASSGTSSSGSLALPDGVGPVSGGKCTVPELVEVNVHDPEGASLEERLFGTRGAEVSVTAPEPCP